MAEQGAQGPQGQQGFGQGFVYRGQWAPSVSYNAYDVVTYQGQTWFVTTSFTSSSTFDSTNMSIWAAQGMQGPIGSSGVTGATGASGAGIVFRGVYDDGTTYVVNDAVYYNGAAWICLQGTTGGNPPPSSVITTSTLPTWIAVNPDNVPASPTVWDDEFDVESSLDPKWTLSSGLTASLNKGSVTLTDTYTVNQFAAMYENAPSGSSWQFTFKMQGQYSAGLAGGWIGGSNGKGLGLMYEQGTSDSSGRLSIDIFNVNLSSQASTYVIETTTESSVVPSYYRMTYGGGNITFSVSVDGISFTQIGSSYAASSYIGTPSTVGVFFSTWNSSATTFSVDVSWFRRTDGYTPAGLAAGSSSTTSNNYWCLLAPQGPQGIQGIQGSQGATGTTGSVGPAWSPVTGYES
jgi:hypothetical protein